MNLKKLFEDKYVGYHTFGLKIDCKYEELDAEHDYSKDYLTFEALEDTEFSIVFVCDSRNNAYITRAMRESFSYSIDEGKTWETFETPNDLYSGTALTTPTIHAGEKVLWKGIGIRNFVLGSSVPSTYACCHFTSSSRYIAYGNIMSIIYGDMFIDKYDLEETQLSHFFNSSTYLISAKNLILPATTLASGCYNDMFSGCTGLTAAPKLTATTLAQGCYVGMFQNCTSLTKAPELPATTLVYSCYSGMFSGCSSLNYIKAMFTTTPSDQYTGGWVGGVSATGTFIKNSAATWNVTGYSGIPLDWTVQTADE